MKTFKGPTQFINDAERGDSFVYHTGSLAIDRQGNDALDKQASDMLEYYQRGFVELIQRRVGKNKFEYVAVRTMDVGRRYFTGCYKQ